MSYEIRRFKKFLIDASNIFTKDKNLKEYLFYKKGDTYKTNDRTVLPGYITSSTTRLCFSFYFEKDISNVNVSIKSFNAELRGINKYLNDESGFHEYVGRSGYTITITKTDNHTIRIELIKSSAFTNVSNNTTVCAAVNLEFSFS